MPLYQYPESQLCGRPVAVPEQLEELPVGPFPNRPSIEERLNVLEKGSLPSFIGYPLGLFIPTSTE